jgi:hypothetical protein
MRNFYKRIFFITCNFLIYEISGELERSRSSIGVFPTIFDGFEKENFDSLKKEILTVKK